MDPFGLSEDDLIDFTPELRAEALEVLGRYRVGGPFMPRLYPDHNEDVLDNIRCYGGLNITHPATLDPTTGILYAASSRTCSGGMVMLGIDADEPDNPRTTGTTISQWGGGPRGGAAAGSGPAHSEAALQPRLRLRHEHRRAALVDSRG